MDDETNTPPSQPHWHISAVPKPHPPIHTILISTPSGATASPAVLSALAIAKTTGARVVAYDSPPARGSDTPEPHPPAPAVLTLYDPVQTRWEPRPPNTPTVELARRTGADLIVVGAAEESTWRRGRDPATAADAAAREHHLLVARPRPTPDPTPPYHHVCVPLSLDDDGFEAARFALRLATPGALVDLVICIGVGYPPGLDPASWAFDPKIADDRGRADDFLWRLVDDAPPSVGVRLAVRYEQVAPAILRHVAQADRAGEPYDLIVVTEDHRAALPAAIRGAAVNAIIREAPCSVLVLQRPTPRVPVDTP